ncbi:MAG TPA: 7-cyano-7-deazaguanine synthase [Acidobacteriota bacterium]|jgi:7-cyano-7-deazaguanine synthase
MSRLYGSFFDMLHLPEKPFGLLCSGGIESCALAFLGSRRARITPIYVRFGLIWEEAELYWLRKFLSLTALADLHSLVVLEMPVAEIYRNHWSRGGSEIPDDNSADESVYLPGRNLLLLSKGAVYCNLHGLSALAVGTLRGNPFPDARLEFFSNMARAISFTFDQPFEIHAPFRDLGKEQVITLAAAAPLHLSFSCINPQQYTHCGRCNKCAERRRYFKAAGVPDATVYAAEKIRS